MEQEIAKLQAENKRLRYELIRIKAVADVASRAKHLNARSQQEFLLIVQLCKTAPTS